MNGLLAIVLSAYLVITTASVLPGVDGSPSTPIPSFCRLENLSELGKCSCFLYTREGKITDELKKACMSAFGDDLLSLEGSCDNYLEDGKIDINAVRKDVAKAIKICIPLLFENAQSGIGGDGLGGVIGVIGAQA